jgi:(4-(4-[2-(gamma-L-glutamylamino)ethyl]phenoxymethyl)furan-2-yl)methanamine synthase
MTWLAIDVGGANLKAADGRGYAVVRPFALWREPARLAAELSAIISTAPKCDRVVATMTGELCDCFETKAAGVRAILDALAEAAGGRPVSVYQTDGSIAALEAARVSPLLAAASNWHALAAFSARFADGRPALLIDIGSTTTDVIPLDSTGPAATACTDLDRLLAGELVYTGVDRTPVSAVVTHLPWRGAECPVASEFFATTADAYLILGDVPERTDCHETADGRPRTRQAAHTRMARMICSDSVAFSQADAMRAAHAVEQSQISQLKNAVTQVVGRMPAIPERVILSGQGEFLGRRLLECLAEDSAPQEVTALSDKLGPAISRAATAHALAALACEQQ